VKWGICRKLQRGENLENLGILDMGFWVIMKVLGAGIAVRDRKSAIKSVIVFEKL